MVALVRLQVSVNQDVVVEAAFGEKPGSRIFRRISERGQRKLVQLTFARRRCTGRLWLAWSLAPATKFLSSIPKPPA